MTNHAVFIVLRILVDETIEYVIHYIFVRI
jgi:hypothetical protein